MKEQILKDIGDKVTIRTSIGRNWESEQMEDIIEDIVGIISMITVTKKGIKYRATFNCGCVGQQDFWQDEIIK